MRLAKWGFQTPDWLSRKEPADKGTMFHMNLLLAAVRDYLEHGVRVAQLTRVSDVGV
jgi:hypothetical protein